MKSLRKQSKVDKVDFLVWHQPFESWLWLGAEGRSQFPKHFQRLSKTFAPRLKTFLFQSPDFRLIKLVIVLLSDYSQAPNFPPIPCYMIVKTYFCQNLIEYFYIPKLGPPRYFWSTKQDIKDTFIRCRDHIADNLLECL